jgi:maltose O-acetyltransferase
MNHFRDIGNFILLVLPVSKFFKFKREILTWMGVEIGRGASVNGHTWFYGRGKIRIGEGTWIGPRCRFYATEGTTIDVGANCDIAPEVAFVTGTHEMGTSERRAGPGFSKSITIGNGCWLGARVTVMGGANIGSGTLVAAGSLVRSDVPSNCLAAGVPAVVKRTYLDS